MSVIMLIAALLSLIFITAAVGPRTKSLSLRDGDSSCYQAGKTPVGVDVFGCLAKYVMQDGNCLNAIDESHPFFPRCAGYCEVRQSWVYGKEVPYENPRCQREDEKCSISNTDTVTVTNPYTFNLGFTIGKRKLHYRNRPVERREGKSFLDALKLGFNTGASWQWTESDAKAVGVSANKPTNAKRSCGYWTFVPYITTSCGTMTAGKQGSEINIYSVPRGCHDITTVPNFCQTQPARTKDGHAAGATIFVAVHCDTGKPASFCRQDPIYLQPGVAEDPSVYDDWISAHWDGDLSKPVLSSAQQHCDAEPA